MSNYQQKDNSGSLWANDKKTQDNHPDRTGTLVVDGREFWVSGWLRKTGDGKPYLSLAVKPKEARQEAPRRSAPPSKPPADMDDDVRF